MNIRHILCVSALAGVMATGMTWTAHAQSDDAEATDEAAADETLDLLEIWPTDRVLGDPDAPVTIVEFSSLTCPHCRAFHEDTLPELKEQFIDTGQANLIIRHFPLDQLAFAAAIVSECVPSAQFHPFVQTLYETQDEWRSEAALDILRQTAKLTGLSDERFDECLANESIANAILATRLRAQTELEVQSTPTFFVAGEKVRGAQDVDVFADIIADHTN